nr:retrovirus-related Pol polyprotein from transposon TNT 1-94 [Tanacetum cinerariifolium]
MRPFGCRVTILNTKDHLGKFDGKADEGFFIGYSLNSKAFRVFNNRTRIVEENLHISDDGKKVDEDPRQESECKDQEKEDNVNNTNNVNAASTNRVNVVGANTNNELLFDPKMSALEDISTFTFSSDLEDDDEEADMNNIDTTIHVSPVATTRIHKDHHLNQVIGDLHSTTQTRHMSKNLEEHGKRAIGTKWVFQNKKDERGIVIRNKARLFTQGDTQEEGIYYDEVFTPIARIKAIRLFLASVPFKDFMVYQMDVKNAFLYVKIEEKVYVCQPPRFEDPDFLEKVYKVEKALYGLHQAPRAWYETLSTYLLDNWFHKGKIDKTLFIRRHKDNILLVQVYVDDIIFGSTEKELCNAFEKMMHKMFQMSSTGELKFFLGLQLKHKQNGIFISQDKYVAEILKKYGFSEVKNASTPIETQMPLLKDEDGEEIDVHMYRSMIGSLMYLTFSRPDIKLAVCCKKQTVVANSITKAEYVAASSCCKQPNESEGFKQIVDFMYANPIKYALTINPTVYTSCIEQFWATVKAITVNGEGQLQALIDGKKVIITESTIRRDLQLKDAEGVDCLPNAVIFKQLTLMGKPRRNITEVPQPSDPISVADKAINEVMDDSLERAITTATSLDVEQDREKIIVVILVRDRCPRGKVVVIDAIVGVVIVVASIGVVVIVMIIGIVIVDGGISLGPMFLLGLSAFAMASAYAFRATATPSIISYQMVASVIVGVADVEVL